MKKFYILIISSLLLTLSCKQEKKTHQTLLPHVIGGMNDVTVIMSAKNWEAEPGKTLKEALEQPITALPQEEPQFDILWMPHSNLSSVEKKQRNIIITNIGPDYKENISYKKNVWAQLQLVVQINAPTPERFVELFNENSKTILQTIDDFELERVKTSYKSSEETNLRQDLIKKHQLSMVFPKGFRVNQEENNFIWFDNRYRNVIEGILVYYYPYKDTNTFSKEFLIAKRDSILKKYIPGEVEGSYAATETRFPTISKEYKLNGETYTYELRGLWHVKEGMAMGGPFISITQFDEAHGRIVTVDAFLFAPGEEKRKLIKRLEAVIYSLEFVSDTK